MSPPLVFSASVGVCWFYSLYISQICPLFPQHSYQGPYQPYLEYCNSLPTPSYPLRLTPEHLPNVSYTRTHTHTPTHPDMCLEPWQQYISWESNPGSSTWNTRPTMTYPFQRKKKFWNCRLTANEEPIKDFGAAPMAKLNGKNLIFIEVFAWLDVFSTTQKNKYKNRESRQKDWSMISVV